MKRMMQAGDFLDALGNNHNIIVLEYTTVSTEVKPWM